MQKVYLLILLGTFFIIIGCQPKTPTEAELLEQRRLQATTQMEQRFDTLAHTLQATPLPNDDEMMALSEAINQESAPNVQRILAQYEQPINEAPDTALVLDTSKVDPMAMADSAVSKKAKILPNAVVENGALLLGVRAYQDMYQQVHNLVAQYEGYIVSEEERSSDFYTENTIIIHTPPENFEPLIQDLRDLAVVIRQKKVWRKDVSEQFVDLKTRLSAKYEAQRRLKTFMIKTENATDILPIQRELDVVTEDLEALTRTVRNLSQRMSYSVVSVTFYEEAISTEAVQAGFGERFSDGMSTGWGNFKEFLIGAALVWPYIIVGFLVLIAVLLAVRSSRKQARQFKLQALQAQQQWAMQQQRMANSTNDKKTNSK